MAPIAVFVDDLGGAQRSIAELLARPVPPALCVMVLCAPKLTHRIGPWATHRSRERWRDRWGARLRSQVEPLFGPAPGPAVEWMVARAPLQEVTGELRGRLGSGLEVLDARRQKFDPADTAPGDMRGFRLSGLTALSAGMSLWLALAD